MPSTVSGSRSSTATSPRPFSTGCRSGFSGLTPRTSGPATFRTLSSRAAPIHDPATDELRMYYGAADTSICLATARLGDLLGAVRA